MRARLVPVAAILYVCVLMPAVSASVPTGATLDADLAATLTSASVDHRSSSTPHCPPLMWKFNATSGDAVR